MVYIPEDECEILKHVECDCNTNIFDNGCTSEI